MSNILMRYFNEPLLHFAFIGAALFVFYAVVNRPAETAHLVVTSDDIQTLASSFSNDWNRVATDEELEVMIEDLVREELSVREGLLLGLDQNDPVVRQRIRQKLELMVEEEAVVGEPTEEELATYLRENSDLFRNRDGSIPPLNEIRNLVIFEWENTHRIKQLDQFYKDLESKYGVDVEE